MQAYLIKPDKLEKFFCFMRLQSEPVEGKKLYVKHTFLSYSLQTDFAIKVKLNLCSSF